MVQPKYNPQESLERIKLMMNYDTSKTLNENRELINEDYHWLLPDGTIKMGTDLVGKIPKGAQAFASAAEAEAAAAALGTGEAAALAGAGEAATLAGAGEATGLGLAALASNPVGWAIDKPENFEIHSTAEGKDCVIS